MAITAEQFKEAARKAAAAGDMATAKSLIAKAKASEGQSGGVSQLSTAFQQATMPQAGPPMPPEMLMRNKAKNYYTQNDMGAGMSGVGGFAQGGTFGFSDELTAALQSLSPNVTYDQALAVERGRLDAARQSHPVAAYGGEVAGAIAAPGAVASSAPSAVGRVAAGAASGALQGGIYGFGTGEGGFDERARSALISGGIGGAVGAALPAIGAGIQKIGDKLATRKEIARLVANAPSTEELKAAGSAAYKAVDDAGVTINPDVMRSTTDDIVASMRNSGLDETGGALSLTPKSARVAQLLDDAAQTNQPIPFSAVDQLRRKAGVAAGDVMNKTDQQLGMKAITGLDDMVNNLDAGKVASGDPAALAENIKTAREVWAKMTRSQLIDDAIDAGESYVSGSGSGIRNKFAAILRNPKLSRGFSDAELAAIRKVANGSIPAKMLQVAAGGMGNLMTMTGGAGLGASIGGIPGMIAGTAAGTVVSGGLRKASDALTRKNAEVVRALIASGGLQQAAKANPQIALIAEQLVRRGLLPAYPSFARSMLAPSSP